VPMPLVHADVDPGVFNRNVPAGATISGDSGAVVAALLEQLAGHPRDEALRRRLGEGRAAVDAAAAAAPDTGRVAPFRLLRALQERFGPETVFTTDSGNGTFLAVEILRLDAPGRLLAPVDYSCMGYAVPAAIGAKLACPERPVVALAGDGAFLMTGLELLTAAHHGLGVVVFVLSDGELAQIAQFQEVALNRKAASALPSIHLEALARALEVEFLRLERDADLGDVVARAAAFAAAGRPVLVDTAIDYSERTYFTRGVVKTNLLRLPWKDRLRFVGRALLRRL